MPATLKKAMLSFYIAAAVFDLKHSNKENSLKTNNKSADKYQTFSMLVHPDGTNSSQSHTAEWIKNYRIYLNQELSRNEENLKVTFRDLCREKYMKL